MKSCSGINISANTRTLIGSFTVGSTGLYIFGGNFEITVSNPNIGATVSIQATGRSNWVVRGTCMGGGGMCPIGIAYIDEPETGIDFFAQTNQATISSSVSKMWYVKLSD